MACERRFLDWNETPLVAAAQHLLDRFVTDGTLQLDNAIVVLPGRRAMQALMETLLQQTTEQGLRFSPPQTATAGTLPELLYEQNQPVAGDLVSRIAWTRALQETPAEVVEHVVPQLPETNDLNRWRSLASYFRQLCYNLTADGVQFDDVSVAGKNIAGFEEKKRWQALHHIHQEYLQVLAKCGLSDLQDSRLRAIHNLECDSDKHIILIGLVEINGALRQMLRQLSCPITTLIVAPPNYADRFDEFGALIPDAWNNAKLDVLDKQISVVHDASQQAEQLVRAIADFEGRFSAQQITIGMADEQLVPYVCTLLEEFGLRGRWLVEKTLPETRPYQLLAAVREFLARSGAREFASLVRHPDVDRWLRSQGIPAEWLVQLDKYCANHLPVSINGYWVGTSEESNLIRPAYESLNTLLNELNIDKKTVAISRPLNEWSQLLSQLLSTLYNGNEGSYTDHATAESCERIANALVEMGQLNDQLSESVVACDALDLLLNQISGDTVPAEADPDAIELLGWLELPLDDAPALIVTSFNEPFVPKSSTGDLFLPDRLRQRLGLDDNRRRYARDAYVLDLLLHTRKELRLIVAKFDTEQNPIPPSRLLFATDATTAATRILRMYREDEQASPFRPLAGKLVSQRDRSDFQIPPPNVCLESGQEFELESMRVTEFKEYLKCPYRYYLRFVLKLTSLDDRTEELDPLRFGSLVHDVLHNFGLSEIKDSRNADEIAGFLSDQLGEVAQKDFGKWRRGAVNVQIQQAKARLTAFAKWQAAHAAKGWRIAHVEAESEEGSVLNVDGRSVALIGRIDRIDINDRGEAIVFDYKSSNKAATPEENHRKKGEWIDLQLPLYRHLAAALGVEGPMQLGYIGIPEETSKTGARLAQWTEGDLQEADATAYDVIRRIRCGEFWPPNELNDPYDEYADICLEGVFERPNPAASSNP